MQVQKIQNNNTNFSAMLRVNSNYQTKMKKSVIEYLETQFPKKTKKISGRLEIGVNEQAGYAQGKDLLSYCNGNGCDTIEIDFPLNETKEVLLSKLVGSLKGFLIREKAQHKISKLRNEIEEISEKAYNDSANKFNEYFHAYEDSLPTKDIAEKPTAL